MNTLKIYNIDNYTAKDLFKNVVKGVNFMTPNIEGYEKIKVSDTLIRVIELSKGEGIVSKELYGVSVVDYEYKNGEWMGKHRYDLSELFYSKEDAQEYIENLQTIE